MIKEIIGIILLTLIPTLELRAAIPYGVVVLNFPMGWLYAAIIAIITNILLGPLVYFILDKFVHILRKIKIIDKIYKKKVISVQKKIFPKVDKYGDIALSFFIAIPLPGTGSYTGALAAYLLGIKPKKFFWINLIGVLVAGIIVTIITLIFVSNGSEFFKIFIKL